QRTKSMADDLEEDEWWLQNADEGPDRNSESEENVPSPPDTEPITKEEQIKGKKRMVDESGSDDDDNAENEDIKPKKKKKKRKKKTITAELDEKGADPATIQQFLDALEKHWAKTLTAIERETLDLKDGKYYSECNDLTHTPVSFLRTLMPKWAKMVQKYNEKKVKGSPMVLIITSAGIRAADLNRLVADFKGDKCKVIKLFAKHIKVKEQVKQLSEQMTHIGVGTPDRIATLIEKDALKLDNIKHIILDWSWRNVKQQRLHDQADIMKATALLFSKHLAKLVLEKTAKIGLL
ncbi:unnamed protein product, partial [Owenia fusiformis]